jgi:hypothetical protein
MCWNACRLKSPAILPPHLNQHTCLEQAYAETVHVTNHTPLSSPRSQLAKLPLLLATFTDHSG